MVLEKVALYRICYIRAVYWLIFQGAVFIYIILYLFYVRSKLMK